MFGNAIIMGNAGKFSVTLKNLAHVLTPLPEGFFKFFKLWEGRRKERIQSVLATYLDL